MLIGENVFIGEGSIAKVASVLEQRDVSNILLVTGKKSFETSGAKVQLLPLLDNRRVVRFSDFSTNPKLEDAKRGVELFLNEGCDFILAIGGGSVLDMAKLINAFAFCQDLSAEQIMQAPENLRGVAVSFLAMPTTAGSGSEATQFAVVYINGIKYSLEHPSLLPHYTIIDPKLTYELSAQQCAISGLDALSQAVESFWAVHATQESKVYAKEAMQIALEHLELSVCVCKKASREAMARAAYYAGKAINITKTTAAHAFSYGLTMHAGIPHGHAVALTLGQLVYIHAHAKQLGLSYNKSAGQLLGDLEQLYTIFQVDGPEAFGLRWYTLLERLGLAPHLPIFSDKDIDIIIKNVSLERLNNNPIKITQDLPKRVLKEEFRKESVIK